MIWNGLALVWIKIPDPQNYKIDFLIKTGLYFVYQFGSAYN